MIGAPILRLLMAAGLALGLGAQDPNRTLRPQQVAMTPSPQESRVALVIGNGAYKDAPLKNPVNDAQAFAATLNGLGFDVDVVVNAGRREMIAAVRKFGQKLTAGGVGLFYYAGHGMAVKGTNYLIPVGVDIASEEDVTTEAMDVNAVLARMDVAKNRVNPVILDACRNNPFTRSFRSGNRGLTQMEAPSGTFVAFATAPGSTAADGEGQNGLYTQHLLRALQQPGLSVEQVFKRVRVGVKRDSRDQQVPWDSSSLTGEFFFNPESAAVSSNTSVVQVPAPPMAPTFSQATIQPVPTQPSGHLQVTVNVPNASVFVDGELKGSVSPLTPLNISNLLVGEANIRVQADGFKTKLEKATIENGKWTQLPILMTDRTFGCSLVYGKRPLESSIRLSPNADMYLENIKNIISASNNLNFNDLGASSSDLSLDEQFVLANRRRSSLLIRVDFVGGSTIFTVKNKISFFCVETKQQLTEWIVDSKYVGAYFRVKSEIFDPDFKAKLLEIIDKHANGCLMKN